MIDSNQMSALFGAIFGALFGFLAQLIISYIAKKDNQLREHRLIEVELNDMERHLQAGIRVLSNIDLSKGKPSVMHFEKLKIIDTATIFSQDAMRHIKKRVTDDTFLLRIICRNYNIEVESVIRYLGSDHYNSETLRQYIDYLIHKSNILTNRVIYEKKLIKNQEKRKLRVQKSELRKGQDQPQIFYE